MTTAPPHSILIIDDDPISREVMAMTLEMHGYAVTSAPDGNAALAILKKAADTPDLILPELILMDTQMPGMSGVELIAALRKAGSMRAASMRIVAISASEPGEAIRKASDGFLLKPVQPEAVNALFTTPAHVISLAAQAAPAAVLLATEPAVDPEILRKFKAMMPPKAVREIYEATASDMKVRVSSLQEAIDAANAPEVSRIAHSIKGVCAMVGLTAGREAASRLEVSNLPVTWPGDLMQIRIALEALEVMLADDFSA